MDEPRLFDADEIDRRNRYVEPGERAKARRTDPDTSHAAAAAVTPGAGSVETAILRVLHERGAMTADEICLCLADRFPPTVKSAISRLVRRHDVRDTGYRRASLRGCEQAVWCLIDDFSAMRSILDVTVRDGVL